jgi:hypothetical protein
LVSSPPGNPQFVEILDSEEKGTDVNLATHLLLDGFDQDYEQAVVVSNDSDLAFPIKMVREKFGISVGIVNPNLDQKAPKSGPEGSNPQRTCRCRNLPAQVAGKNVAQLPVYSSTVRCFWDD